MISLNGTQVKPTIFPDGTSQVWKLDRAAVRDDLNVVLWEFESEAELFHVAQLKQLIDSMVKSSVVLSMPYLPYGRQDKAVGNFASFALNTFAHIINSLNFEQVNTVDPHSSMALELINNCAAIDPSYQIANALEDVQGLVCYPDAGAADRYGKYINKLNQVVFAKVREPLTGEILGLDTTDAVLPTSYLIVDDICDGGRTFIEAAKVLYAKGAKEVHLYISHGIFSKGVQVLRDAGIKRIFTYEGEV